jgi:hypothetical protein
MVYEGLVDPTTLEALACREALALSEDLALTRIHVASDCYSIVSDIREGSLGRIGSIISEIRSKAALFDDCSFIHEGRVSNLEAHSLARHALPLDVGHHVWLLAPYIW